MKKFALCLAIAAAIMMVPFSAFGLQMMNNHSMDQITGQAGVSIAFDDVQIFMNIDRFTYIDPDGLTNTVGWSAVVADNGAAFNVNEFQIDTLKANAIINTTGLVTATIGGHTVASMGLTGITTVKQIAANGIPLQYTYNNNNAFIAQTTVNVQSKGLNHMFGGSYQVYEPQAISIDISDAAPVLSQGKKVILSLLGSASSRVAAVVITLPTAEFYIDNINIGSMTLTDNVIAGTSKVFTTGSTSLNNGASFGSIEIEGVTFTMLNGWVEIAPH